MKRQSGQALVLVLLSLAVVLTIVLFILARSVTDVAVSSRSEEAVRAFSAAEAGIENALVIGAGNPNGLVGCDSNGANCSANFSSNVSGFAEGSTFFNYPVPMSSGDSMTTWFVAHDANGNLNCSDPAHPCFAGSSMTVCWGEPETSANDAATPAIEASLFYENPSGSLLNIKIGRATADPNSGRAASNKFGGSDGSGCTISGTTYAFQKTLNFADLGIPLLGGAVTTPEELQFARIRIFYNDVPQPLGITVSGGNLPSQGQDIVSTGTAGNSNRKVAVFQGWPEPPAVFDYAIYSGTGLTK